MERKESFIVSPSSSDGTESASEIIDQISLTGSEDEVKLLINGLQTLMGELMVNSGIRVQTNIDSPRITDVELLLRQISEPTAVEEPVAQEPATD